MFSKDFWHAGPGEVLLSVVLAIPGVLSFKARKGMNSLTLSMKAKIYFFFLFLPGRAAFHFGFEFVFIILLQVNSKVFCILRYHVLRI